MRVQSVNIFVRHTFEESILRGRKKKRETDINFNIDFYNVHVSMYIPRILNINTLPPPLSTSLIPGNLLTIKTTLEDAVSSLVSAA